MTLPQSQQPNKLFDLSSYHYDLPNDLIAQYPLKQRDQARLMVINRKKQNILHDEFSNLDKHLQTPSTFVVNNSRVIPARLLGRKLGGQGANLISAGKVEVFLLKALPDGFCFQVLLKPLKRIHLGQRMDFGGGIEAELIDKENRIVRFNKPHIIEHLKEVGHIPLPPYIDRDDEASDREDYQTVYAKESGSVAAPTAGLHFTDELIYSLKGRGDKFLELTLHINYGTFKPVECADIRQHPMHSEPYVIDEAIYAGVLDAKAKKIPVIGVGTTSARVLESAAISSQLAGETDIFIYPGFEFKMIDHLITNFHLPQSTLLMLVAAFGGYDLIMKAYKEAIKERYRFYSYGDAMLIL